MTSTEQLALKQQMHQALNALYLEVDETVADGVKQYVLAYVQALERENERLTSIGPVPEKPSP